MQWDQSILLFFNTPPVRQGRVSFPSLLSLSIDSPRACPGPSKLYSHGLYREQRSRSHSSQHHLLQAPAIPARKETTLDMRCKTQHPGPHSLTAMVLRMHCHRIGHSISLMMIWLARRRWRLGLQKIMPLSGRQWMGWICSIMQLMCQFRHEILRVPVMVQGVLF